MRAMVVIALLAVAAGASGCARDGDQATVRSVTDTFFAALGSGDGARACEQLSPNARAELESRERSACREAVARLELHGAAVVAANVYVFSAKVDLANGESAFLDQGREGWRISAAGCASQGKPADRPFDCELED